MDLSTPDPVRDALLKENHEFREMVTRHQNYESRLSELGELTYPNDDEILEESTLKKKKLALKDEIYAMIAQHSNAQPGGH
jgi:uncharacterized protein YdcH (DUF465 family)